MTYAFENCALMVISAGALFVAAMTTALTGWRTALYALGVVVYCLGVWWLVMARLPIPIKVVDCYARSTHASIDTPCSLAALNIREGPTAPLRYE